MEIPLTAFLLVAAFLFAIGLFTVLSHRSSAVALVGIQILFSAVVLNAVAFWRFLNPGDYSGQMLALAVVTAAGVQSAFGLAILTLLYRRRRSVRQDRYQALHG